MNANYFSIEVCEDCYISHHYGYRPVTEDEDYSTASGARLSRWEVHPLPMWWVGEGDQVSPLEPLNMIPEGADVTDNTCSDHDGTDNQRCQYCDASGYENGLTDFSWRSCEGCGSTLGGARYRLAIWPAEVNR